MNMKDQGAKRKRLDSVENKPPNQLMEDIPIEWIYNRKEKGERVSRNLVMKKALLI